ncbi:MAG: MATE family efflux transporter [Oscillospiraceae bacterium]|nr:MATE family efflux transporter [Oscillospiraceae bacterium]
MGRSLNNKRDLTQGSIFKNLIWFSLPYMASSFLQTFYGMADLFVVGRFLDAASITAVSVGSQITHMLTLVIVGLAMGSTVLIGNAVGEKNEARTGKMIGGTISLFIAIALILTAALLLLLNPIIRAVNTPAESVEQVRRYLFICFLGTPFITAYNVLSSVFRSLGDTRSPMAFVAVAGVINIALDFLLVGLLHMEAYSTALATVLSQMCSILFALVRLKRRGLGVRVRKSDLRLSRAAAFSILKIGVPVALQDGLIQVSFLVITAIANGRGVDAAAGVGIVEKIISFLFLVPSAMLSAISVIGAQCIGAGAHERCRRTLFCGMAVCVGFGLCVTLAVQISPQGIVGLFTGEAAVVLLGGQYLRSYVADCVFAGIHFCFSGYFCAYGKSGLSFVHNVVSSFCVRIPGAYLAATYFPATLFPMGLAAPAGSLVSALLCLFLYRRLRGRQPNRPVAMQRDGP